MTTDRATGSSATGDAPVGRDAVMAAVLGHAADLFAERGPAATSIRDIAERAGVNHGLVFRHFGTKDRLVARVLDQLAAESVAVLDHSGRAHRAVVNEALRRHLTVLARSILDGYPVARLQRDFPVIGQLIERARPLHESDRAAALAVAHMAALVTGWQVFEPFLRGAAGLEDMSEADLRADIELQAAHILRSRRGDSGEPAR